MTTRIICSALLIACICGCGGGARVPAPFDLVIRGGAIYDGKGGPPVVGDVAIRGDRIVAVGDIGPGSAPAEIDARGLAVAPGFINMLSWATETLLADGRSQGDIRQGVTLEVFGEGWSMGPLNQAMKEEAVRLQGHIKYPVDWTTLGEYLERLTERGISPNVASFVGATTVRIHEVGYDDRAPSAEELGRMKDLVRAAIKDGALGVASALIYAPAFYAKTPELIELARAAGESGGIYITHMRSEGNRLLEALDEVLAIAREAGVAAEIYHLKAAGKDNWPKLDELVRRIEAARASGLAVTADMYTYPAAATGLDAAMPPWIQEGGFDAWKRRLKDPETRARAVRDMRTSGDDWENLLLLAGTPENVLLVGFKNDALRPLTGKTLAEVARTRGTGAEETAMDLVVEDDSRVETVYFLMSEDNIRKQLRLPWVSLGSDAESMAPEGVFLKWNPHPRAYGNFARLLGKYVRDESVLPLQEAVRRMTWLPASNLKLRDRGCLAAGSFADVVVFDPAAVRDRATFDQPQQFAEGIRDVLVNGVAVLKDGRHTGALPGRVVRGPGWDGKNARARRDES